MISNEKMLADAEAQLRVALDERRSITKKCEREGRAHFNELEESKFIAVSALIKELRGNVDELREDLERRDAMKSTADRIWQASNGGGAAYRQHDAYTDRRSSYVRDLIGAVTPAVDKNGEGRQRLSGLETRDVSGLTSSTAFDPPAYLLDLYARVSRPNAPLYSLLQKVALTSPVVKTPKIATGNTGAMQTAENDSLSPTTWADEYVTTTPNTYAAATYVSDQALSLSPVALDNLIFEDLFAALAVEIEHAVLYDSVFGLDSQATASGTVFSTGSSNTADTLASFAHALNAIAVSRFNTSNVVAITHPSVVLHWTSQCDNTGRPIYLGPGVAFNPAGIPGAVENLGQVVAPALTIQGVPIYADASVTVTGGTAPVYFTKLDDSFISEYGPSSLASPHTAALQIAWLLRCHSIIGLTCRYPEAIVRVSGFQAATTGFGGS